MKGAVCWVKGSVAHGSPPHPSFTSNPSNILCVPHLTQYLFIRSPDWIEKHVLLLMIISVMMSFVESMPIDKCKSGGGRILCRWDYDPPSGHGQAQMGLQTQPGISCVTFPTQAPRWPFSHQIKSFLLKANINYYQKSPWSITFIAENKIPSLSKNCGSNLNLKCVGFVTFQIWPYVC